MSPTSQTLPGSGGTHAWLATDVPGINNIDSIVFVIVCNEATHEDNIGIYVGEDRIVHSVRPFIS